MKRRDFLGVIGSAAAWPLAARAQQSARMRRVGMVMGSAETDPAAQALVGALRHELQKLGWVEGRDIRIDVRFASADPNQIRTIAAELMSPTPDLIVSNTNLVTAVLQAEVRTIPIIFITVGDPVGSGFVSNEARPNRQPHGVCQLGDVNGRKMGGAAQGGRAPARTHRVDAASRDGPPHRVPQIR